MTMLHQWAHQWGVQPEAVADLQRRMGLDSPGLPRGVAEGSNEAAVSVRVRLVAACHGVHLWRNNVGAMPDQTGRWVRFGLCNDSKGMNEAFKSGDLIGCRPVTIEPHMVGWRVGQFVSREVKAAGWHYTGTPRETAQLRWAELVMSLGGDAQFTTGSEAHP